MGAAPATECSDAYSFTYHCGQAASPADTFVPLAAGTGAGCALRTTGEANCWLTSGGRLFNTPRPVEDYFEAPAGTFSMLSMTGMHVCGLGSDGTATCWGYAAR